MTAPFRALMVAAVVLGAGACASTGAVPQPFPTPGPHPAPPPLPTPAPPPSGPGSSSTSPGYAIAGTALSLRGAPYRDGGADPHGFDCSGFVQFVFARNGLRMPRTVTDQYHAGQSVAPEQIQPGDLVFFTTVAPGASHVGIAIGGDEFVHAPSERGEVRVEHLSSSYWLPRFIGARRVT